MSYQPIKCTSSEKEQYSKIDQNASWGSFHLVKDMTKVREYTSRHVKVRVVSPYTTHNERQNQQYLY